MGDLKLHMLKSNPAMTRWISISLAAVVLAFRMPPVHGKDRKDSG